MLSYAPPLAEISPPVATSSLCIFSLPLFTRVTDAANGVRSRFSAFYPKANYGLQGSQPSDVRAHNRAANGACDEYKQLKVLSMGRQKAVIKARREAKRVLRRDSRSHKQREEE